MLNTLSNLFNELKAQGVSAAVVDNAACGRISNNIELLSFVYEMLHDGEDNARLRSLVKSIERANRLVAAKKDDANEAIPLMLAVTCSVLEENGFLPSIFYDAEWNLKAIGDKLEAYSKSYEDNNFIMAKTMEGYSFEQAVKMLDEYDSLYGDDDTDAYGMEKDTRMFNLLQTIGEAHDNAIDMGEVIEDFVFGNYSYLYDTTSYEEREVVIDDNYDDDLPF